MIRIMMIVMVTVLQVLTTLAHADEPEVGRKAASKFFKPRAPADVTEVTDDGAAAAKKQAPRGAEGASEDRYLAVQLSTFVSSHSYRWGDNGDQSNVGEQSLDVTYRIGDLTGSVDLMLRADLSWFDLAEGSASRLDVMPMVIFPEATSRFTQYFCAGAGPGVYMKQVANDSALSLDYQLVAGARLYNLYNNMGATFEMGLKNHFNLLGNGQFNGVFLGLGTVFLF
jgi:hypothetical protein